MIRGRSSVDINAAWAPQSVYHSCDRSIALLIPGEKVIVTADHLGEPMSLNAVVQSLHVTLTGYGVKIHDQSKV